MPASSKSLPAEVGEVWQLVLAYLKQETIEEVKPLGRFLLWGVLGSVVLAVGLVELLLAGLRALQSETGTTFTGHLSWLPYLIVLAGCALIAALAGRAISAKKGRQ